MTRQDTGTRRVTTAIVLAVGLFAGGDSYAHIFSLARSHGQDVLTAALLPLAGDGLIAAASAVMLVASRQGRGIPLRARVLLLGGIAATVAAQRGLRARCRAYRRAPVHLAGALLRRLHGAADVAAGQHRGGRPLAEGRTRTRRRTRGRTGTRTRGRRPGTRARRT